MRRIFDYLEYLGLRSLVFILNLFPFSVLLKSAEWIGPLLQKIVRKKNEIALDNLRQAYRGEKSEGEIREIARQSFINMVKLAFEFIRIPQLAPDPDKYLHFVNQKHIWKALEQNRGVILIISHFGNWELMAIRSAKEGLPMNAVARPLKNPYVYAYVKKLRGWTGLKTVNKSGAAREIMKLLSKNQVVCLLIDQREREGGIPINFFNRPALTNTLPALLALRRDIPVIPCFHVRKPDGTNDLVVKEPFELIRNGNPEEEIRLNTQQFIASIENEIRKDPGNWLWMHRRWRL